MGTGPSSQLWPPTPLDPWLRNRLDKSSRKRQLAKRIGKRGLWGLERTVGTRPVPTRNRESDKDEENENCDRSEQEEGKASYLNCSKIRNSINGHYDLTLGRT